jgi:hypothetical protein
MGVGLSAPTSGVAVMREGVLSAVASADTWARPLDHRWRDHRELDHGELDQQQPE